MADCPPATPGPPARSWATGKAAGDREALRWRSGPPPARAGMRAAHGSGWLILLVLAAGCGGSTWHRVPLQGAVTLDGSPAPDAGVMFLPSGQTHGPAVTAPVRDGSYQFSRSNGPVAGAHEVRLLLAPEKMADGGAAREEALPSAAVTVPADRPYDLPLQFETP